MTRRPQALRSAARLALFLLVAILWSAAAPARAEPLTVLLDWYLNPDHAPLVVALEKGYFADAGLEVELVEPADPNDPPKMVAAGKADLAVSYQPQLHIQVAAGLPLVLPCRKPMHSTTINSQVCAPQNRPYGSVCL